MPKTILGGSTLAVYTYFPPKLHDVTFCRHNNALSNVFICFSLTRVEGKGSATITEVAFQTKQLTPDEESSQHEKEKQLRKQLEDGEKRHKVLLTKQHRLRKQRDVLDGFADNVKKAGSDGVGVTAIFSSGRFTLESDLLYR